MEDRTCSSLMCDALDVWCRCEEGAEEGGLLMAQTRCRCRGEREEGVQTATDTGTQKEASLEAATHSDWKHWTTQHSTYTKQQVGDETKREDANVKDG